MTQPATQLGGGQMESIQLTLDAAELQNLGAVLPWVLHALQERPGLSAKQRRRRQLTHTTLSSLLARVEAALPTPAPTESRENGS